MPQEVSEDQYQQAREDILHAIERALRSAADKGHCTFSEGQSAARTAEVILDILSAHVLFKMLSGFAQAEASRAGENTGGEAG